MRTRMAHGEGMTASLPRARALVVSLLTALSVTGCTATVHPEVPSDLGAPRAGRTLEDVIETPGPVAG